jgi:hypothetical protein
MVLCDAVLLVHLLHELISYHFFFTLVTVEIIFCFLVERLNGWRGDVGLIFLLAKPSVVLADG